MGTEVNNFDCSIKRIYLGKMLYLWNKEACNGKTIYSNLLSL